MKKPWIRIARGKVLSGDLEKKKNQGFFTGNDPLFQGYSSSFSKSNLNDFWTHFWGVAKFIGKYQKGRIFRCLNRPLTNPDLIVFKHAFDIYSITQKCGCFGGHSIAPKTASANAANATVHNRQMISRPIIL